MLKKKKKTFWYYTHRGVFNGFIGVREFWMDTITNLLLILKLEPWNSVALSLGLPVDLITCSWKSTISCM